MHIAHFDNIIALPLLLIKIFGSMFLVSFLQFRQYDSIIYVLKKLVSVRHIITYLHTSIINNLITLKRYS